MAPLFQAVNAEYAGTSDDKTIFKGDMDPDWVTNGVPHGGYVLAQVLESLVAYQLRVHPQHQDPFHLSAHYLSRNWIGPCVVHVKEVKHGRSFTNLTAEFIQQGKVTLVAHSIFGSMEFSSDNTASMSIEAPSPFARRLPIHHHPSHPSGYKFLRWKAKFYDMIQVSEDKATYDRNKPETREQLFEQVKDEPNSKLQKLGGGGAESARWVRLKGDKNDHIRASLIAYFVDMQLGFPVVIPDSLPRGRGWQATLVLTIQFFFPIPKPGSPHHSSHTAGVYGRSNFMAEPFARHDSYAEVWTAPTNIGEGEIEEGWREKQVCLASATQMAVAMPMALTRSKTKL